MDLEIREKLRGYTVGVAGLGGLGSNVAVSLARIGIGKLVLVDFDLVEKSNLNRQYYFKNQVGEKKTTALKQVIGNIDESIELETIDTKLNLDNTYEIFKKVDILVEALDDPAEKAMLINEILSKTDIKIVSGSGLAGYGSNNLLKTKRILNNLYICGDGREGDLFLSPRVNIVAHQEANTVLRLILGLEEV